MQIFLIVLILLFPTYACAQDYGPYRADVVSVYDGDTFTADVHVWPGQTNRVNIRIDGIDTPEIRTKNDCEKALGYKAKAAMQSLLASGTVVLTRLHPGKYAGRMLATVNAGGVDVTAEMIRLGHAREYHGGKRLPWCAD